jgi:hypothetical protein
MSNPSRPLCLHTSHSPACLSPLHLQRACLPAFARLLHLPTPHLPAPALLGTTSPNATHMPTSHLTACLFYLPASHLPALAVPGFTSFPCHPPTHRLPNCPPTCSPSLPWWQSATSPPAAGACTTQQQSAWRRLLLVCLTCWTPASLLGRCLLTCSSCAATSSQVCLLALVPVTVSICMVCTAQECIGVWAGFWPCHCTMCMGVQSLAPASDSAASWKAATLIRGQPACSERHTCTIRPTTRV